MPNVMAALPTIGGALCPTPQFGWRPLLECRAVTLPRRETRSRSRLDTHTHTSEWRSGSALVLINEVNLRRARLVLGWVTVSGFDSRRRHFISVRNQPPRWTQPSTLRGTVKWVTYQPKGGDALRLGSKGCCGLFAGKTVLPYMSALENKFGI